MFNTLKWSFILSMSLSASTVVFGILWRFEVHYKCTCNTIKYLPMMNRYFFLENKTIMLINNVLLCMFSLSSSMFSSAALRIYSHHRIIAVCLQSVFDFLCCLSLWHVKVLSISVWRVCASGWCLECVSVTPCRSPVVVVCVGRCWSGDCAERVPECTETQPAVSDPDRPMHWTWTSRTRDWCPPAGRTGSAGTARARS